MAYKKLTKKQYKDRERILAWLEGREFREYSQSRPVIPDLSIEDVLEQYIPPDVTGAGQYFTPPEMARALLSYMDYPRFNGDGVRILDPCAGIGHLLFPLADMSIGYELVAYELEEECVRVGQKLFPKVEWHWEIPFDCIGELEGRFDFVVMNPPFGTHRGMSPGHDMCGGRCAKSEHCFFELAVRACRSGGQIAVIAPFNFVDRFPKALRAWLRDKVELVADLGQLPGEFAFSSISVNGFIFRRLPIEETKLIEEDWQVQDEAPMPARVPMRMQGSIYKQLSLFGGLT